MAQVGTCIYIYTIHGSYGKLTFITQRCSWEFPLLGPPCVTVGGLRQPARRHRAATQPHGLFRVFVFDLCDWPDLKDIDIARCARYMKATVPFASFC